MSGTILARYVTPWTYKREQQARRVAALRQRDGDSCTRCRRPLRFDLPAGADLAAKVEEIVPSAAADTLDNLCLTHVRCNASSRDDTAEVTERVRRKAEAALFDTSRARRRA